MSKKKTITQLSVPAQAVVLLDGKPYGIKATVTQLVAGPGGSMVTAFDINDIWRLNWDGSGGCSHVVREINADPYKYATVCDSLGEYLANQGKKEN